MLCLCNDKGSVFTVLEGGLSSGMVLFISVLLICEKYELLIKQCLQISSLVWRTSKHW